MKIYTEEYKELVDKYRIACGDVKGHEDEYDVIYKYAGTVQGYTMYRILKNAPGLIPIELAIICDKGNLCFGYRTLGNLIYVYTD